MLFGAGHAMRSMARQLGRPVRRCSTGRIFTEPLPTTTEPSPVDDEEFASLMVSAAPTVRFADAVGASATARVCELIVDGGLN